MIGDVVEHRRYGRGTIVAQRHSGFEALVEWESGVRRWVEGGDLAGLTMSAIPDPSLSSVNADESASESLPRDDEKYSARAMIEAFRTGIVPEKQTGSFTFGRVEETGLASDWLHDDQTSALALLGQYGAGKTHFLHHLQEMALGEGYATAVVSLDPNETALHKPKRVYREVVRTLRIPGITDRSPFRWLVREAISKNLARDQIYFMCLRTRQREEAAWAWIEGREPGNRPHGLHDVRRTELPPLYDYSSAANIYCYLLSSLGAALRKLGHPGLLILFDEAESIDISFYRQHFDRGLNFSHALLGVARGDRQLMGSPADTGLDWCKVGLARSVPFAYALPCGLRLVFAFTPTSSIHLLENGERLPRIELNELTEEDMNNARQEIRQLYASAYGITPAGPSGECDIPVALSGATRVWIKAAVEALDLSRFSLRADS
jgi:hypothetical protein